MALLFVCFLVLTQAFSIRQEMLGYEHEVLDVRVWYSPADVETLWRDLGANGRHQYALSQVTLDIAFPFTYALLLAILVVRLYSPAVARWLLLLPLLAAAADLCENVTIAYLAWGEFTVHAARMAATFTTTKFLFFGASLLAILTGGLLGGREMWLAKKEAGGNSDGGLA